MKIRDSLFFISVFCLQGCYLAKNAYHFGEMYNSRKNVDQILKDQSFAEETKEKLRLAIDILDYAESQGLSSKGQYREYIDIGDRPVSYIVQAAEWDALASVTWWFPIVGTVPYLGFFDKQDREKKSRSLKEQGYDVYESEASAFSALGWFKDPLLSSYLDSRTSSLAKLLFHELTHATVWISGSVDFNENLASYVGDFLTIQYLESRKHNEEIVYYQARKRDRRLFESWLKSLKKELKLLYSSRSMMTKEHLRNKKRKIFESFLVEKKPEFTVADYVGTDPWNNATVLASGVYFSYLDDFEKAHKCVGNLKIGVFLETIKEHSKNTKNPFDILKKLCMKDGAKDDDRQS